MSHPPETSLSCRELAEQIWVCADDHSLADDYPGRWKEKAAALIDAWVRVREANMLQPFVALLEDLGNLKSMAQKCDAEGMVETPQKEWTPYQGKVMAYDYCIVHLESTIATARKQLGEKL